jgi:putative transposase
MGRASVPALLQGLGMDAEVTIYRRRLPHWRQDGAVYFVTWRLQEDQAYLKPEEKDVVTAALNHFEGEKYELLGYVVMHNHVHILVYPLNKNILQSIVHSWKSYTANILQRKFGRLSRIWQDEYFDRIVRDEEEFLEKAQYILNNPLKTWPDLDEEYQWMGFKMRAGAEARPTGTEARLDGTASED